MSERRRLLFWLICLAASFSAIEVACYAFLHFRAVPMGLLYQPEDLLALLDREQWQEYLRRRDPDVGWPPARGTAPQFGEVDASGARRSPAFPTPGGACVSLYGDSFTWGAEVGDADAWGNVLAERIGCRVSNYGVSGYGTDQAFLRFRKKKNDEARVVILGHATVDIVRNVSRWVPFRQRPIRLDKWRNFKPRFVLDAAGELELIPLPAFDFATLQAAAVETSSLLPGDFYAPGAPAGPVEPGFPFSLTTLRAVRVAHRRGSISLGDAGPWPMSYYRADHASGALPLTEQILVSFCEEARARKKEPVVLLITTSTEVQHFQSTGEWFSKPLGEAVAARTGAPVVHTGEEINKILPTERLCSIFSNPDCGGHYNARGYAYVASIAREILRKTAKGI